MLALLFAALAVAGVIQAVFGLFAVRRFAARPPRPAAEHPPVTILRPLYGTEPLLEDALVSCCRQSYPGLQIVFGVQDPADPALVLAKRMRERFPAADIAIVVDPTPHGANRKVANLINMMSAARYDVLIISDSDLHVAPDYVERLVTELLRPGTGLSTATCVGLPADRRWPARLGATHLTHSFLPGVLFSRWLGRQDCLGTSVAIRRDTLERCGGLAALKDFLAEDNVLGQYVKALGLTVGLADTVAAATVPETSLRALWQHEIRWSRTIRGLAPVAHAASSLQYPLFWAVAAMVAGGGAWWAVGLFAATWLARAAIARGIDAAMAAKLNHRDLCAAPIALLPLRDMVSVAEIAASFCGNQVVWRGHKMKGGV